MAERLFLLDGMALAYRAYFALINNPLKNSKGENTSAVFGFTNTLIKILQEEKPDYIAAVFDTAEPTFRHKKFPSYKATRQKMPEDMLPQLPRLKQVAEAFGVPVIELHGYEADDIIGTLSVKAANNGVHALMVTADKDFMQLISDKIKMYNPFKKSGDVEIIDTSGVKEKFGVLPGQVTDILGLMGDTADNIPGVKGVGEKTAIKLVQEYGSIENLFEKIGTLKGKLKENLESHRDDALLSKELATIDINVPVAADFHSLKSKKPDYDRLIELFKLLEFKSLLKKFSDVNTGLFATPPEIVDTNRKQSQTEHRQYRIVDSGSGLDELIQKLSHAKEFAFSTETTGSDPMNSELVGLSVAIKPGEAYFVPANSHLPLQDIIAAFKSVLENASIMKFAQNIKYDMLVVRNYGIDLHGAAFDTTIASHLINSEKPLSLDALTQEYLNYEKISISDLTGSGKNQTSLKEVPIEKLSEYACEKTDFALRLHDILDGHLKQIRSDNIFYDIEIPLIQVLSDMEYHGVWLNMGILKDMSAEFAVEIKKLEKIIYKEAGTEFNLNSPQQLGDILFEKLNIHKLAGIEKPRRTGKTGQYATDVKILEMYKSLPIVDAILNYRQLTKLKSTYIDGLPPLVNPKTHRIHSTFSQTIASTGRLSSSNPNFQNIPIRTDVGREIRKAFTPQHKDWLLLSADYSQIELRVLAHMSDDPHLIEAFANDEDIHTSTASRVFKIPKDAVTKDLRRKAKDINFGIIYGISAFGLSSRIGISNAEAKEFIDNYFSTYPKVKMFIESILKNGREDGFVTTMFGRRRYLPDLKSKNYTVRQFAERAATNTPIQGTAAEVIKIAMINVHNAMIQNKLKAKMILQVHDELVFEAPIAEIKDLQILIKDKMENAVKLKAPLKIDIGVGENWLETK
ncbi:DNA polymerase I [bacterium]|nr:DNA polymerase I [bacterium]